MRCRTDTALALLARYAMFASKSFPLPILDPELMVTVGTFESQSRAR